MASEMIDAGLFGLPGKSSSGNKTGLRCEPLPIIAKAAMVCCLGILRDG